MLAGGQAAVGELCFGFGQPAAGHGMSARKREWSTENGVGSCSSIGHVQRRRRPGDVAAPLCSDPGGATPAGGKSYKISGPGHMLEDLEQLQKNKA